VGGDLGGQAQAAEENQTGEPSSSGGGAQALACRVVLPLWVA
jgi:hypothetical protein